MNPMPEESRIVIKELVRLAYTDPARCAKKVLALEASGSPTWRILYESMRINSRGSFSSEITEIKREVKEELGHEPR